MEDPREAQNAAEARYIARWRAELLLDHDRELAGRRRRGLRAAAALLAASTLGGAAGWPVLAALSALAAVLLCARALGRGGALWRVLRRALRAALSPLSLLLYALMRRGEPACAAAARRHEARRAPAPEPPDPRALSGWRLDCRGGRQVWSFEGAPSREQTPHEREHLGLAPEPPEREAPCELDAAIAAGAASLVRKQQPESGHWAHDYGGPLFLLPGAVFAKYVMHGGDTGAVFTAPHREQMRRYLRSTQRPDGGWGLHVEGASTLFGTALNYVALRLLGEPRDSPPAAAGRAWIARRGGAAAIPSWGKFWLCVLGLYEWRGLRPVSPELWLLPQWCPLFPGNLWCHTRMVYLPMSYLYGRRWRAPETPLLKELRADLFPCVPYDKVDWGAAAYQTADTDCVNPVHWLADAAFSVLSLYEHRLGPVRWLRDRALSVCARHIAYDDCTTNFICLGPVNKAMNMVVAFAKDGWSEHLRLHDARLTDYLWLGRDGMKMQGYNGSQLWDAAFACQAVAAAGLIPEHRAAVASAMRFVADCQVRQCPPLHERFCRQDSSGAWNFSTAEQGWQVSDCTAEGLRCGAALGGLHGLPELDPDRMRRGVDQILRLRNPDDGAWCSYEPRRAPVWLELLNPSDVFTRIMVEYTYPECTSACVQALRAFQKRDPDYRAREVGAAAAAGGRALLRMQRSDGSWHGSWGVCITYATMFGIEGLAAWGGAGAAAAVQRAKAFLLSKQRPDGGWAEDFSACLRGEWVEGEEGSQVVQTAWALIALVAAGCGGDPPAARAARFLCTRQRADGSWPQERLCGVFNGSCGIHYGSYRDVFPLWALGLHRRAAPPAPASARGGGSGGECTAMP
eukprot:TRINITY_DN59926_c0_g1_i1.p1 TRINITY_DN59926_c0_g1~~TRINITY_DN59926_c0_g1_i1.p1  ORF type:complete len:879 (+),score=260.95 TRINITY_DN59926_c0_g1_i1:73-2637(+)